MNIIHAATGDGPSVASWNTASWTYSLFGHTASLDIQPMALAVRPVFSSSAEGPAVRIDRLRRALCTAETATGLAGEVGVPLTLGIPLIDDVLSGGLSGSALHEIAA